MLADYRMRTYRVCLLKALGEFMVGEVLGRVVAVDSRRAVEEAKLRWGNWQEYWVQELTDGELGADFKIRPSEPIHSLPEMPKGCKS